MSEQEKLIVLLSRIDKKLSFIIGDKIKNRHDKIKDQVRLTQQVTDDYNEVASILGISPSHAAKELSKLKKKVK
jgi:hypothetical protein